MTNQSVVSLDYAAVRIRASVLLDTQAVSMAFLATKIDPVGGDWKTATWIEPASKSRLAGVLVGPSGLALAKGDWHVWWSVTSNPEIPARYAGVFTVT